MPITIRRKANATSIKNVPASPRNLALEDLRRVHLKEFARLMGVSTSTFYMRLSEHRYPAPDGYDGKRPYWLQRTVYTTLNNGV